VRHRTTAATIPRNSWSLVLQPLFLLFFDLYLPKDSFINDVTLTIGDWNSVHTAIVGSGPKPGHWNETYVLTGLTVKFFKDLEFDAFYTAFLSQVDAFDYRVLTRLAAVRG
jgi:hypothetical protein